MAVDVEDLYRRYGGMVVRRCRRLLRDEDEAMDAAQDTFVRVMRYQDRLTQQAPSSLLYTIATNVCLNRIRSKGRAKSDPAGDLLEQIAHSGDNTEEVLVDHFLERLFSTQKSGTREIAVYHYLDGMTLEETAAASGLSVSGVRKRLRTLRRAGLELVEQ